MSMQRKLWSISALATELQLDRRTVAKKIDGIAPAGRVKGAPVWRLNDVLPALTGRGGDRQPAPPPPPGCEALAGLGPAEALALGLLAETARNSGSVAAALAVQANLASPSAGPALAQVIAAAVAHVAGDVAGEAGLKHNVVVALVGAWGVTGARFDRIDGFDAAAAEALVEGLTAEAA